TLSNTTNKDENATVSVQLSGPLDLSGDNDRSIKIPANSEQRIVFNVGAQSAIGAAKVTVSVKTSQETFTDETDIGVRPPASLQKVTGSGSAGETAPAMISLQNKFIPSTASAKLVISKSPLVAFTRQLSELINYPYGCVEQTTSTAFPQLYYYDL